MSTLAVAPPAGTARALRIHWADPSAPRLLFTPRGADGEALDLGFPAWPALRLARLDAESCRHLGRAFVHDVNGKCMGISCIVTSAGMVDLGRLPAADAALVEEALRELRDLAAIQTTLLRTGGPTLAQLSASRLAEVLPKLLISCFRRHRVVEASGTGESEPLPTWAIRTVAFVASAAAHVFDQLEPVGQPFRFRLHWSSALQTISTEFRVNRWAEDHNRSCFGTGEAPARDLILACAALADSASTPGNDLLQFDFREPETPVKTLLVGDDERQACSPSERRVSGDPPLVERAVLAHSATLETIYAGDGISAETEERVDALARLFGVRAVHA